MTKWLFLQPNREWTIYAMPFILCGKTWVYYFKEWKKAECFRLGISLLLLEVFLRISAFFFLPVKNCSWIIFSCVLASKPPFCPLTGKPEIIFVLLCDMVHSRSEVVPLLIHTNYTERGATNASTRFCLQCWSSEENTAYEEWWFILGSIYNLI